MDIQLALNSEILILLISVFLGVWFIFFIVSKNFIYGIYIWLLTGLFLRNQKIEMIDSMFPNISIDRILFIFLVFIFIMEVFLKKRRFFNFGIIEYSMLLFCLFAVFSMMCTGFIFKEYGRLRIGPLLSGYLYPFIMFYLSQNLYDTSEKRENFIKFIIIVGLYLTWTAIFEHFRINGLVFPRYIMDPEFGIHFGRSRGPFGAASANGVALGFAFAGCFYFLFRPNKKFIWRIFSMLCVVLSPIAIFFTYTRASWLAFFLGFLVLLIFYNKGRGRLFIAAIMIFVISFIAILSTLIDKYAIFHAADRVRDEGPVYERLNLYTAYISMFMKHPLFGIGFGRFRDEIANYIRNAYVYTSSFDFKINIHDTFMGLLAETGLVGILLIFILYYFILLRGIRLYKYSRLRESDDVYLLPTFFALVIIYIVNSMFFWAAIFDFINCVFFIFAGIICGLERSLYTRNSYTTEDKLLYGNSKFKRG